MQGFRAPAVLTLELEAARLFKLWAVAKLALPRPHTGIFQVLRHEEHLTLALPAHLGGTTGYEQLAPGLEHLAAQTLAAGVDGEAVVGAAEADLPGSGSGIGSLGECRPAVGYVSIGQCRCIVARVLADLLCGLDAELAGDKFTSILETVARGHG